VGQSPPGAPVDPRNDGDKKPQKPLLSGRTWWLILAAMLVFNLIFYYADLGMNRAAEKPQVTLPYSAFVSQVRAGNVTAAHIDGDTISGDFKRPYRESKGGTAYPRYTTTVVPEFLPTVGGLLDKHHVKTTIENPTTPFWMTALMILLQGLPFLLLVGLLYFGSRQAQAQQQGMFGFGRSRAKMYTEERPSTTFADVAGVDTAKNELSEIVDFLRDPTKYHRLGARIPKGVLLTGPPGTGKTLLARAVAGEAHVPFFSISSSEFVEMFVGVGASRVRDLFERAKTAAPAIVFVDEIDAIGGQRGRGPGGYGSNDEREQTLNQLLVSMDGFEPNEAVIILAATNRPDILDQALLRPGRFDRQVVLDLPDRRGREAILRIHTRKLPLGADVDLKALGQATPGMSGADLANLANEAALTAARKNASQVTAADFDQALDRVTLGTEGAPLMNEEERRIVAYHEGGHALVALILPNVDPVHRVTITPRGRSLGVTQFRPSEDRRNYRRDYLLNRMAVALGGRAAEEVACEEITSGAQNDIQQVTAMARAMVLELGMVDDLGPIRWGEAGLDGQAANPWEQREYSDETAKRIDHAVVRLVTEAHERALDVLKTNRAALDAIARALVHEESLTREELTALVNEFRVPEKKPLPVPSGPPTPTGETPAVIEPPLEPAPQNQTRDYEPPAPTR
jgi:cell division protease FtsH